MAIKTVSLQNITYQLSYELLNPQQSKVILFLHGWGSNKEAMKNAFKACFTNYQHIYLDLPGFGHSSIKEPIDTTLYTMIVEAFLKQLGLKPTVVFGHSFGGKVATLLKPEVLVLLSSAGIVPPKSLKIKTKIWFYKTFKSFFPQNFYRYFVAKDVDGMSQIMYETFKKVVNEDFTSTFAVSPSKTYLFWGNDDTATPLLSGEKIHALIKNSHFLKMSGDHFFFLRNGKNIEKLLLEFGF